MTCGPIFVVAIPLQEIATSAEVKHVHEPRS